MSCPREMLRSMRLCFAVLILSLYLNSCAHEQKNITSPPDTEKAREEVTKAVKIGVWDPVHLSELTPEEQELIIPQMMNYLEKYKPGYDIR